MKECPLNTWWHHQIPTYGRLTCHFTGGQWLLCLIRLNRSVFVICIDETKWLMDLWTFRFPEMENVSPLTFCWLFNETVANISCTSTKLQGLRLRHSSSVNKHVVGNHCYTPLWWMPLQSGSTLSQPKLGLPDRCRMGQSRCRVEDPQRLQGLWLDHLSTLSPDELAKCFQSTFCSFSLFGATQTIYPLCENHGAY